MNNRTRALGLAVVGVLLVGTPVHGVTKSTTKAATKSTTKATTKATTKPAPASTAAPTTAAPTASAGPKGTLKMATFIDSATWDPIRNTYALAPVAATVYDTLLRRDKDGNPTPGLALSYSQPDKRTWRFKLRPNVKFTDGTPWDAAAAKYNIDRAAGFAGNPQLGIFAGLTEVVVVDPMTIDVKFAKGNPAFPFEIGAMGGSMVSPKVADLTRNPVGTGGWIYDKGASQEGVKYVFTANPDYWDKANQRYAKIEIYPIGDNGARVNALLTGQVDYIDSLPGNRFEDVRKAGFRVFRDDNITASIVIGDRDGTIVPALGKREVRQAMQLAMNQEAYVKAVLGGIGVVDNSIFKASGKWYNPENSKRYAYDKEKAKALLAKAGYPDGFEVTLGTYSTLKDPTEAFQTVMADVGIRVRLVQVTPAQLVPEFTKRTFPLQYLPFASGDPYTDWATLVSPASPWNPFKIDNTIMDALAARSLDANSDAERKRVYRDLEQAMQDEGLVVVMGHAATTTALRKDAKGDPYTYSGERGIRPYLVDIPVS